MEKKMEQKGVAQFEGLSISKGKVVTLKVTLRYDEMITSVNLLQGLQTDITVHAKVPDRKPFSCGVFNVHSVNFDKDGNAKIVLKSMTENVELNNLCSLADEQLIQLRFLAVLELPDNGGGE